MDDDAFALERDRMVDDQLRRRDITDPRVLAAMRQVPRHRFIRAADRHLAYADSPLPIGMHQTISQPYIVALMTQWLEPHPDDQILEIGTGSGYQAAIVARLVRQVISVERIPELAAEARRILAELGVTNVEVVEGDGTCGHPDGAPYAGILVTAGAPHVPDPLRRQLAEQGPAGASGRIARRADAGTLDAPRGRFPPRANRTGGLCAADRGAWVERGDRRRRGLGLRLEGPAGLRCRGIRNAPLDRAARWFRLGWNR